MIDPPDNPVAVGYRNRRLRWIGIFLSLLVVAGGVVYWKYLASIPVDYEEDVEHFKYGSIGSDAYDGIPLRIWKVLPSVFPEYLPEAGAGYLRIPPTNRTYLDGYRQFGFLVEADHPLPVGFSQRRLYVDRVGLNCAVCHTSTVRVENDSIAKALYGYEPAFAEDESTASNRMKRAIVLGMPANTVDLEAYFAFLFRCAEDSRFNADTLMAAVQAATEKSVPDAQREAKLGFVESRILRRAVPQLRQTLLMRRRQLAYIALLAPSSEEHAVPRFGPGRIDTFSPYKSIQFGFPHDGTFGIADYPSIWNQRPREKMQLHWDGNNTSVFERNISASLGAGATPVSLDMHRMLRVASWIGSPPPPNSNFGAPGLTDEQISQARAKPVPKKHELQIPSYPFPIDTVLAARGKSLFRQHCATCHDWQGERVGRVVSIASVGTDPARLDSYDEILQANQNMLGVNQWWRFRSFRKTNGYANMPLDGVWARAPLLHNGSVPTLVDLLNKPCDAVDLARLGITADADHRELEDDPTRVASIIAKARSLGLRPPLFFRGDDEYDPKLGGFRCDRDRSADGRRLFLYSTFVVKEGVLTTLLGNGHSGHFDEYATNGASYGKNLTTADKLALVEYQKTIGGREAP